MYRVSFSEVFIYSEVGFSEKRGMHGRVGRHTGCPLCPACRHARPGSSMGERGRQAGEKQAGSSRGVAFLFLWEAEEVSSSSRAGSMRSCPSSQKSPSPKSPWRKLDSSRV